MRRILLYLFITLAIMACQPSQGIIIPTEVDSTGNPIDTSGDTSADTTDGTSGASEEW